MKFISIEDFENINNGIYQGENPLFKERRTVLEDGKVLIEGIDFLVYKDYQHLPTICKENAIVGGAYVFCGGYMILERIDVATAKEIYKFELGYKEHFIATAYVSAGMYEIGGGLKGTEI